MSQQKPNSDENTNRMPVLFVGHGNPMYAIEENEFVNTWHRLGEQLPLPKGIISISAHWETNGTAVTSMLHPRTIHDFGGFPDALYQIQYPAPGDPELAHKIADTIPNSSIRADESWGLDHGTWSVVRHLFPNANVPIIQLSLDYNKTPAEHIQFATGLSAFRDKGVLIIGSGNIVHNLRQVSWDKPDDKEFAYDWAIEANEKIKELISTHFLNELSNYKSLGLAVQMAIPTPEHFLPLLYALALKAESDDITYFNDKIVMGSLSMTSLIIG